MADTIVGRVLNGTHPDDWPSVLASAKNDPRIVAAVGLHPSKVDTAPAD
jgi:Tat protein secretion system quality control protein TatD with DNase activity